MGSRSHGRPLLRCRCRENGCVCSTTHTSAIQANVARSETTRATPTCLPFSYAPNTIEPSSELQSDTIVMCTGDAVELTYAVGLAIGWAVWGRNVEWGGDD